MILHNLLSLAERPERQLGSLFAKSASFLSSFGPLGEDSERLKSILATHTFRASTNGSIPIYSKGALDCLGDIEDRIVFFIGLSHDCFTNLYLCVKYISTS